MRNLLEFVIIYTILLLGLAMSIGALFLPITKAGVFICGIFTVLSLLGIRNCYLTFKRDSTLDNLFNPIKGKEEEYI